MSCSCSARYHADSNDGTGDALGTMMRPEEKKKKKLYRARVTGYKYVSRFLLLSRPVNGGFKTTNDDPQATTDKFRILPRQDEDHFRPPPELYFGLRHEPLQPFRERHQCLRLAPGRRRLHLHELPERRPPADADEHMLQQHGIGHAERGKQCSQSCQLLEMPVLTTSGPLDLQRGPRQPGYLQAMLQVAEPAIRYWALSMSTSEMRTVAYIGLSTEISTEA